jgi:hypothetical protein
MLRRTGPRRLERARQGRRCPNPTDELTQARQSDPPPSDLATRHACDAHRSWRAAVPSPREGEVGRSIRHCLDAAALHRQCIGSHEARRTFACRPLRAPAVRSRACSQPRACGSGPVGPTRVPFTAGGTPGQSLLSQHQGVDGPACICRDAPGCRTWLAIERSPSRLQRREAVCLSHGRTLRPITPRRASVRAGP